MRVMYDFISLFVRIYYLVWVNSEGLKFDLQRSIDFSQSERGFTSPNPSLTVPAPGFNSL